MTHWEYETVKINPEGTLFYSHGTVDADKLRSALNEYGAQGWEMVAALDLNHGGTTSGIVLLFKRPAHA